MDTLTEMKLDYRCHRCKKCIQWLHKEYCAESSLMINKEGIVRCININCQKKCNILDCEWECIDCVIKEYGNINGMQNMIDHAKGKENELHFISQLLPSIKDQFLQRDEQLKRGTFELSAREKKEIQLFNYGIDSEFNCGIKFRSTFPVEECKEPDEINDWKHEPGCGGDILLYKDGKFGCSNCDFSKLFEEYELKCKSCSSSSASNLQISHALEAISQYPSSKNLDNFAEELINCLNQRIIEDLKEIVFSSQCPVKECSNNKDKYPWTHAVCGERVFLILEGNIKCKSCDQTWLFKDFPFNCPKHSAKNPSLITTIKVLSALISQEIFTWKRIFLMEVFKKISEQFNIADLSEEIKVIKFETICPIEQCSKKNTRYTWKHPICGKELLLTNEGKIKCQNCKAEMLFCDFPFKCEDHNSKLCSIKGATRCLDSIIKPSTNKEASNTFIVELTMAVMTQFEKNPRVNEIDFIAPCPNVNFILFNK